MKTNNITHQHLINITKQLSDDFQPFGKTDRDSTDYIGDCSCNCKHYIKLQGKRGADWGVCTNQASHRCGLLTFEHQGCLHCEETEPTDKSNA